MGATSEVAPGRGGQPLVRLDPGPAARDDAPAPARGHAGSRCHAQARPRAARRADRAVADRQPADGAGERGRAGRDRLRRDRPALRPHLVHPPRRPGHDRQPAQQGGPPAGQPGVHQGPHHDRADRPRNGQLPGRVRDDPGPEEPLGDDPVAWRSTSRTASGRRTPAASGRSTRPSCSTSRAAGSPRTRPASSSRSASWSRSWPASRSSRSASGCGRSWRRSGRSGASRTRPPRERGPPRRGRAA